MLGEKPSATPRANADRGRRRWHFAGAILDEGTLELRVNGVDAELERKPLEVLVFLLQHAGEVCTKDELLAGVWPGRILSETVLTKCIGRLRDVLGDRGQDIIKTSYGFGYRIVAPVRIESVPTPEPARFDFRPGDHPPARPLWSLVERLGIGRHGEAWRARHEKTHEQRVFKFALDEASLGALKREITLFRIINDSLGDRARIVRLVDWNLEQLPYFVETEYIGGGSLVDWTRGRGGIAAIPLAERLEVVAKIAAALAAVHSVSVLHRDLKPSSIFVKPVAGQPIDIALGDFGSGGLLDASQVGITRAGFTKTIAAPDTGSVAPIYMAPEVLNGEPFTVKSDVYSLGVVLYQFLTGDFHRALSPGWERDIDDELLREDIAMLAEVDPALRLADADTLAKRLRSLDERRSQVLAQREAQAKAERTHALLNRARARRAGVALAFAALSVGIATSTGMYFNARRAQEQSAIATAQSKAVTDFLGNDALAPVSNEVLTRAGNEIDQRFPGQPQVASELHYVIGRSFHRLHEYPSAVRHFNRALELGQQRNGAGAGTDAVLRSASELVEIDYMLGNLRETIPGYEAVLAAAEKRIASDDGALLELRERVAVGRYHLGDWSRATQALEDLLETRGASVPPSEFIGETEFYLGQALSDLARSADAEVHLRRAVDVLTRTVGAMRAEVAAARAALGRSLADSGQYAAAAAELDKAQELATRLVAPDTWAAMQPRYFQALLLLQQDLPDKAEPILARIVEVQDAHLAANLQAHTASAPALDHTGPVRQALGEAYAREGKFDAAIVTLQRAVAVSERADGPQHPASQSIRLSLAECLVAEGRDAEARAVLATRAVDPAALPTVHPIAAQLGRVNGLLAQHEGNMEQARKWFGNSLSILQSLYGPQNWRVIRARQELQRAAS